MADRLKKSSVSIIAVLLILILMAPPTGYEDAAIYKGTERKSLPIRQTARTNIRNQKVKILL